MPQDAPLFETLDDSGSAASGQSGGATGASASGPSLTIQTSGSTVEIGVETLQFYLLAIQTVLLVYVTYKEVGS